jgi:hypothetical protein
MAAQIARSTNNKKKNFSSFNKKDAFKQLNIQNLLVWDFDVKNIQPSNFFQERLIRLKRYFDLDTCEESKKLLIDAICEEAMGTIETLKIWKGAHLKSENTKGIADYLVAERKGYLEAPYLCIIEAKKDDFEQGLAQCLVEMQACQWETQQAYPDRTIIDILGIVSNGTTWQFYKLTAQGQVYETSGYAIGDMEQILGRVHYFFQLCEKNLK